MRDYSLLESALESAFATFDGNDLYPSKEEKGAKIGYSLISNHAFVDGNKRIGMYVMLTFLEVNGIKIDATNKDVENLAMSVASSNSDYADILEWIQKHKTI